MKIKIVDWELTQEHFRLRHMATATCKILKSFRQSRSKNVRRDSDKSKTYSLEYETLTTATHFVSNCTVCKSIAV